MKRLLLCSALSLILAGCGTSHTLVKELSHDTLYMNTIQYDSVYLYQNTETDRSKDTVLIHDILREYKYKFLKDTVRVVSIDSIPVIHEVEIVKTERYIPSVYKWSLGICIVLIVIILVMITIRVIRIIRVRE